MRPVERGPIPLDNEGNPKEFTNYTQARRGLIDRIGEYCSYCEMHLNASLAIEHIQPKSLNPELEVDWDNFLLACANCNSTKGNTPIVLENYFWPDHDNTARAYEYEEGGTIVVAAALSPGEQNRALRMIDLVGLNKIPGNDPAASDRRWQNRREAWGIAKHALKRVQNLPVDEMREQVVDTALAEGFWSIWMTVFIDDSVMRQHFITEFRGTSRDSFDNHANPIPRPNGDL